MELKPVRLVDAAAALPETWSPAVVARLGDQYVKVARVHGEFVWHAHAEEDEAFLVLRGSLVIRMEEGDVTLEQGDLFVVPRGVRHCPVAEKECLIALIEPVSTAHTGDVVTERTRSVEDQLRAGGPPSATSGESPSATSGESPSATSGESPSAPSGGSGAPPPAEADPDHPRMDARP